MEKYVLSLDTGTTSCRCLAFARDGGIYASHSREYGRTFPADGYVEQDALEIWTAQRDVVAEVISDIGGVEAVECIGIANQRETVVVWDKVTGIPVHPAVVWQCRRTADFCEHLREEGYEEYVRDVTGLVLDPYFSGTKVKWILDHVDGARERAEHGDLLFGNIDTWIIWNLTGGRVHVTDYSNASRTMLFDIRRLRWDDRLLQIMDVPRMMLPEPRPSSEVYGYTDIFGGRVPICGDAGDQQASLFGQGCFRRGDAKNTYGTGCFMLMNTGDTAFTSGNRLLTTVAWGLGGKVTYALEGSVFSAGDAVEWFRDLAGLESPGDIEQLARGAQGGGCFFVPAFNGLGAPYWDPQARTVLTGISAGAGKAELARAVLDGVALLSADVFEAMREDTGRSLNQLYADGGMSRNDLFLQIQADVLGVSVIRSACSESTARGAAFLAGLATGFWRSVGDLPFGEDRGLFVPTMSVSDRDKLRIGWMSAVQKSRGIGTE